MKKLIIINGAIGIGNNYFDVIKNGYHKKHKISKV